jgi:WD40 repeat protein
LSSASTLGILDNTPITVVHAFDAIAKSKLVLADVTEERVSAYVETEQQRATSELQSHLTSLSFDAGGTWLVTSGADGVVAVWNPSTGVLVDALAAPASSRGGSAIFVGETSEVLIVDGTGQTYRWNLGTDAIVEHVCAVVERRLDEQEWQRFFGDAPYRATCP